MDTEFMVGDIVKSASGHDKNRLFLVVSIDKNGDIAIINGKHRKRSNPKFKNPKHLIKVAHSDELFQKANSPIVTETEIYNGLKKFNSQEIE